MSMQLEETIYNGLKIALSDAVPEEIANKKTMGLADTIAVAVSRALADSGGMPSGSDIGECIPLIYAADTPALGQMLTGYGIVSVSSGIGASVSLNKHAIMNLYGVAAGLEVRNMQLASTVDDVHFYNVFSDIESGVITSFEEITASVTFGAEMGMLWFTVPAIDGILVVTGLSAEPPK